MFLLILSSVILKSFNIILLEWVRFFSLNVHTDVTAGGNGVFAPAISRLMAMSLPSVTNMMPTSPLTEGGTECTYKK